MNFNVYKLIAQNYCIFGIKGKRWRMPGMPEDDFVVHRTLVGTELFMPPEQVLL